MAKRRSTRRRSDRGWLWSLLLLLVAVAAAAGAGWYFLKGPGHKAKHEPTTKTEKKPVAKKPEAARPTEDPDRFEFYNMLPSGGVEVPEDNGSAAAGPGSAPVNRPGTYVLQAGAFPDLATADAVKARLALLGIAAEIQPVTVDDRVFHRVRIGPIDNLPQLNSLRARLHANKIDNTVIPVDE